MPTEPTIRPIRIEEAAEAKRLIYAIAHPLMDPHLTLEAMIDQWESHGILADLEDVQKNYFDNDGVFLVVEVDGCIVGTGAFHRYQDGSLFSENGPLRTPDDRLRTGDGVCALHRITLLPSYGGHKLATLGYALIHDLIDRARAMGFSFMVLWTNPIKLHRAVDFYHRLGFQDIPIEGTDPDELWMGLEIAKENFE